MALGVGLRFCISNKLIDIDTDGPKITLEVVNLRVKSFWLKSWFPLLPDMVVEGGYSNSLYVCFLICEMDTIINNTNNSICIINTVGK